MKSPKEVIIETETARMEARIKKGAICSAVGIPTSTYSFVLRAGLKDEPVRIEALNKIRKHLSLKPVVRQIVMLEVAA